MQKEQWKSRNFILFAVITLTLLVSACSGNSGGSGTDAASTPPPAESGGAPSAQPEPIEKPLEPVTYTMNSIVQYMQWDNPVAKEITERTGVTIKWENVATNEAEKVNLWLVGGDYPDLLWLNDAFLGDYVKAKAVHDLTDLIKEHGPDIMAAFNNDLTPITREEGRVWAFRAPPVTEIDDQGARGWVHIQIAVLEEAGWPEIKTLDDVYNVVSSYAAKYPEINGGKTIGFSNYGNENQFYNNFEIGSSGRYMGGPVSFGPVMVDSDNSVRFKWFDPGATDVLRMLNKANANGLFDQEWLVQTPDQFKAKCTQGRVLAALGAAPCSTDLAQLGMGDRQYISFDVLREGTVRHTNFNYNGSDRWLAISKNVDDPVRVIKFMNEMYKLENQILMGWGMEGSTYQVVDGVRAITDGVFEKITGTPDGYEQLGLSYGRYFMLPWQAGAKLSDGDFARFNISTSWVAAGLTPEIREALKRYNAETFADMKVEEVPVAVSYGSMRQPDDVVSWRTEAISEWNKAATKVILESNPSKIDAIWAEFEQTMKNKGLDEMNAKLTQMYKEHLAE